MSQAMDIVSVYATFDREISPRAIDPEVDARLRGSIAHAALHRFYAGLPKRLGSEALMTPVSHPPTCLSRPGVGLAARTATAP